MRNRLKNLLKGAGVLNIAVVVFLSKYFILKLIDLGLTRKNLELITILALVTYLLGFGTGWLTKHLEKE